MPHDSYADNIQVSRHYIHELASILAQGYLRMRKRKAEKSLEDVWGGATVRTAENRKTKNGVAHE